MPISNKETNLGLNRTGILMSPINSAESKKSADTLTTPSKGDSTAIADNRISSITEAGLIGTLPIPANVKGMITSIEEKVHVGNHALLDKLGERLAFERTGTRLYEAILSKYQASRDFESLPPLKLLEQFYQEELLHFYMLVDIVTEIGGDPTAITPAADLSGVSSQGIIQIITDPRTTFIQSLEALLHAELIDNAGWELLIGLATEAGLNEYAEQFLKAKEEEDLHLEMITEWVSNFNISGEAVVDVKSIQ
ncbi:MAG: hypothetical protein AB7I27_14750 [Bacteriovoracaceae bacterium]